MHESVSVHWVGVACVNTSLCIFDMLTVVVTLSAPFSMPLPRLREIRSLCHGLQSSYILSNSSSFSHPVFCVLRADENHWGGVEGCFLLLKNDSTKHSQSEEVQERTLHLLPSYSHFLLSGLSHYSPAPLVLLISSLVSSFHYVPTLFPTAALFTNPLHIQLFPHPLTFLIVCFCLVLFVFDVQWKAQAVF